MIRFYLIYTNLIILLILTVDPTLNLFLSSTCYVVGITPWNSLIYSNSSPLTYMCNLNQDSYINHKVSPYVRQCSVLSLFLPPSKKKEKGQYTKDDSLGFIVVGYTYMYTMIYSTCGSWSLELTNR